MIGHSGQVDRHRVAGEDRAGGNGAGATRHGRVPANDIIGEGEDKGVISIRAAAFHSSTGDEWQIDIECARSAVGLARDDAGDLQWVARIGHRRQDLHCNRLARFEEADDRSGGRWRFVRIEPEVVQRAPADGIGVLILSKGLAVPGQGVRCLS